MLQLNNPFTGLGTVIIKLLKRIEKSTLYGIQHKNITDKARCAKCM